MLKDNRDRFRNSIIAELSVLPVHDDQVVICGGVGDRSGRAGVLIAHGIIGLIRVFTVYHRDSCLRVRVNCAAAAALTETIVRGVSGDLHRRRPAAVGAQRQGIDGLPVISVFLLEQNGSIPMGIFPSDVRPFQTDGELLLNFGIAEGKGCERAML